MRAMFVTAELAPLVRVGGLAEAASGLVKALRDGGTAVDVVVPDYFATPLSGEVSVPLDVAAWASPATARTGLLEGFGAITLISVPGIERVHPYVEPRTGHGWSDNDRRFFAFSAAAAAYARLVGVDVVHVNDWHTGAVLGLLDPNVGTVLSLHNLAYQGMASGAWLGQLGYSGDRLRAYECFGSMNPLAGAITSADRIVAVSPTYAKEILEPEQGFGLDALLRERGEAVIGILNGIDGSEWDPAADGLIPAVYSAPAAKAKQTCRDALLAEMGIDESGSGPVVGVVTRLVEQKGVDVMLDAVQYLRGMDARLVVLGAGDPGLSFALRTRHTAEPQHIGFHEGYDLGLAHRIFAGSDLFLMPSRFEPCGLAQMQAMAYGTIPVTTSVGGLVDTVIDADDDPEAGNGFRSAHISGAGLVDALHRANNAWRVKARRRHIVANGMGRDWSWAAPAAQYLDVYEAVAAEARARG